MISDITDASSQTLDLFMDKGQKSLLSSNAKSMKMNQDKPGEETLCQPLGKWYKSGNDLEHTWPSYYNSTCTVDTYRKDNTNQGQDYRWVSHMA
eukprot:14912378-Ditylum_brightwellii.AAC.1